MTQEQKELLFKDLCGRLPYGVKAQIYNHWRSEYEYETLTLKNYNELIDTFCVEDIKPYLFPISSMTEEQKVIYGDLCYAIIHSLAWDTQAALNELVDWLNKNHFDYRGLIQVGLAIDATNKNIY